MMLLKFIVNFCILFTFAILMYMPFQNKLTIFSSNPRFSPLIIGCLSGLTGCILIFQTIVISDYVIVDGRLAVIILSGILGGPLAPIVSGIIIGTFRIFVFGYSPFAFIAGINTIIIAIVVGLWTVKKPMTFQNSIYYFVYGVIQTAIVIAVLHNWSLFGFGQIVAFLLFSIISFFIIYFVQKKLNELFYKIQQIEEMSETDYLTGLNNNRKFQEHAQNLLMTNDTFSLILLDIDFFKKVNDSYGHPIGDEILKELGLRLKDVTKSWRGIVSRNGGEEFTVLLPGATAEKGMEVAEIIRLAIEEKPFRVSTGELLNITISGGVSTSPENGRDMNELYKLGDKALYIAKTSGRNKIIHINEKETNVSTDHEKED